MAAIVATSVIANNMNVRLMKMADVPSVFAIEVRAYEFPWSKSLFEQALSSTKKCVVLEENELIIGYAIVSYVVGEAELLNICIDPQQQGKQFGKSLLKYVIQLAQENKNYEMYLEVRASNVAAQALYLKHDFNEIGRRKNYYPNKNGREDAILMARSLEI